MTHVCCSCACQRDEPCCNCHGIPCPKDDPQGHRKWLLHNSRWGLEEKTQGGTWRRVKYHDRPDLLLTDEGEIRFTSWGDADDFARTLHAAGARTEFQVVDLA